MTDDPANGRAMLGMPSFSWSTFANAAPMVL